MKYTEPRYFKLFDFELYNIEEFIQDALIKFINQNQLNGTNTLPDL